MRLFFDERCLLHQDLDPLLKSWRQITDYAAAHAPTVLLFLDRQATASGDFLQRLNHLRRDLRVLYTPMLFGTQLVDDWRSNILGMDTLCQLSTEGEALTDCAVCEVYAHRTVVNTVGLLGGVLSSFVGHQAISVTKIEPQGDDLEVVCGTGLPDFIRIGTEWECLLAEYDQTSRRPPRDHETILGHDALRFARTGRFERNGRRRVYRENATNRFFYVDNLHCGAAAHLEVFDTDERHIGTADLRGNIDPAGRIEGRVIAW
jgi:hypothetical protein